MIGFHHSETIPFRLKHRGEVRRWLALVAKSHKRNTGRIDYRFAGDEEVYDANRRFLSHDTYTDIITFDESDGDVIAGDILISIDRVRENAQRFGVEFTDELHRVMAHGVLHLCGFGDKRAAERNRMRGAEEDALALRARFGL